MGSAGSGAGKETEREAQALSILFLDACIVVYRFEGEPPIAARVDEALSRLQRDHRDARMAVSDLSRLECRVLPLRLGRSDLVSTYDRFFAASSLTVVPLSPAIVDLATVIRARSGLRTADALQAASCLSLGQQARFITSDRAFRREAALDVIVV